MRLPWLALVLVLSVGWPATRASAATVTMVTLDDRPCNTLFVQQLAAIAGIDLILSTTPADALNADCVSLNTVAAGSLVASRSTDPSALPAPHLRPDALVQFAVPRAQPFVKDAASLAAYSAALQTLANPDTQEIVRAAIAGDGPMPADTALADYARRLRGWLAYLDRAAIPRDRLLITLDDNRPGPLAAWLKLTLERYSDHVQDGTDEGMMLLLARWLREHETGPAAYEIGLVWTDPAGLLETHAFESGMPVENTLRMTDWLHVRVTSDLKGVARWRPVLWIHAGSNGAAADGARVVATVEALSDRPVVVADIAALNKGDAVLMNTWQTSGMPPGIVGYLGWNTSSNTLGSAIALWSAIDYGYAMRADPESVRGGIELFLWARLLDDYLYQAEERTALKTQFVQAQGWTEPFTEDQVRALSEQLQFDLLERYHTLGPLLRAPFREADPGGATGITVTVPWDRLFEIGVIPCDPRGFLPTVTPAPVVPSPR